MDIHVAHSPDSDDAFMFYALATHKIDTGDRNYIHLLNDIETLNRKALEGEYEVSAISFHAYAYMADKYALLSCGASMGDKYGPMVITRQPMKLEELRGKTIAIPGKLTTAFLALHPSWSSPSGSGGARSTPTNPWSVHRSGSATRRERSSGSCRRVLNSPTRQMRGCLSMSGFAAPPAH